MANVWNGPTRPSASNTAVAKGQQMANKNHNGHWIQGAIKHPGALHKELGVPQGQKIPAGKLNAAAKKGGKEGARARLAKTLKGLGK